ncbi:MAG TPA: M56 family metallopeptidase, partial [Bryobacteraceae bacterium]|nr:M56 family metallopeptidase [Bryobacteraceae bacterium]
MLPALIDHLWQSTLFAVVAVLLAFLLRHNHARARYWLWLAASLKFLIPFALLVTVGSQVHWRTAPAPAFVPLVVEQASQPFTPAAAIAPAAVHARPNLLPILSGLWLCGFALAMLRYSLQWRKVQAAARSGAPTNLEAPIEVRSSPSLLEPGVFGIWRPVLLLPEGIARRLTPEQLRAILAHELSHVRRRDNLFSALHMLVEALFWFHPLVWWIGARLVEERERACDEEVSSQGHAPHVYAEGILKVCQFYLESPLSCAAGVTGSDLKKRIERIMRHGAARKLNFGKKILLAAAGVAAVVLPVGFGLLNASPGRAQATGAPRPSFEVASVKPSQSDQPFAIRFQISPGGRLRASNVPLRSLIAMAYRLKEFQLSGGPG